MISNYKKQIFEPRLPLKRVGGVLETVDTSWENVPAVQFGTLPSWWGNKVGRRAVGSVYAETIDEPIQADGEFLARREALALAALAPLDQVDEIQGYTTEATNPINDRVDMVATVDVQGVGDQVVVEVRGVDGDTGPSGIQDIIDDGLTPGIQDFIDDGLTPGIQDIVDT
jgi:hypothetical protein